MAKKKKKAWEPSVSDVKNILTLIATLKGKPTELDIQKREEAMKSFMKEHQKELHLTGKYIEEYKIELK